jgi:hypothetical protein
MIKALPAVLGAAFLSLALTGTASAQATSPSTVPAPVAAGAADVHPHSPYGYYIWLDGHRVHLRTTDPGGDGSLYTGAITVDGRVETLDVIRDEPGDIAVADRNTVEFRFYTFSHVDGLALAVRDTDWITFRLFRNGHLISTEHIFLGAAGAHPPGNPFVIVR